MNDIGLMAVLEDPGATRNERDAADMILKYSTGRAPKPDQEIVNILHGYMARQVQQDRYGK